jgi:Arc/MetJ-type ribon-helix-helix transcriptional regulator
MATVKAGVKKTVRKKNKKKLKKQAVLSVVSVRISDKEKERIDKMMQAGIISNYSDVLRLALQMMPVPALIENESLENSDQNRHYRYDDVTSPFQAVCRNNDAVQSELRHVCQTGW